MSRSPRHNYQFDSGRWVFVPAALQLTQRVSPARECCGTMRALGSNLLVEHLHHGRILSLIYVGNCLSD